jgi:hypothetical protein
VDETITHLKREENLVGEAKALVEDAVYTEVSYSRLSLDLNPY